MAAMRGIVKRFAAPRTLSSLLVGLIVLIGLLLARRQGYLLFHSIVEIFSIVVAFGIFTVFWNARRFLDNGCFLFLGIAYLFVGVIDLLHTLAYEGMGVFPSSAYDPSNLATQLWVSARFVESGSLLAAPLFLRRRFEPSLLLLAYGAVVSLLLASIFYWRVFPDCFVEGLTPFKKNSEYVISLVLIASLALLFRRRREFDARVLQLLAMSIMLTIASEVAFTQYKGVTGTWNLVGHYLKLVSFYLIYVAFVEVGMTNPYAVLFRNLKESEKSLRESEARFRGTFDNAAVGIAHVDFDGRWLRVNQRLCDILGYSSQEIVRKTLQDLAHPDDLDADAAQFGSLTRGEIGSYSMEKRYLRRNGDIVWIGLTMALQRDRAGNPLYCIAIVQDITKRKDAERQLKAINETLEQRVAERTSVAEQRAAQLRALASELTLTEQRERRRLAQTLHDHLQQLLVAAKLKMAILLRRADEEAVQDLVQQVKGLLDDSIQASRSLTVELSPPILYDAGLAAALEWLARQMQEKHGLSVQVEADPEAEPAGEDLRVLIFQAVRELLFNVVKHAQTESAHVKMARFEDQQVHVSVTDRGVGFDGSKLHADDFSRAGFGLFAIRERLGLMGGRLEIDAAPGKGAHISIFAPRLQPAQPTGRLQPGKFVEPGITGHGAAGGPVTQPARRDARAIRVLLADDHKLSRQVVTALLRDQPDIEVVGEASDGQMAVELALRTQPDVVVMDVAMPRLDGLHATRRITAELPHVRVIGLSMHAEAEIAEGMREAGAVAYLPKGCSSADLIAAIRGSAAVSAEARPRD
jgi:PAS domain S-box-containing protein